MQRRAGLRGRGGKKKGRRQEERGNLYRTLGNERQAVHTRDTPSQCALELKPCLSHASRHLQLAFQKTRPESTLGNEPLDLSNEGQRETHRAVRRSKEGPKPAILKLPEVPSIVTSRWRSEGAWRFEFAVQS